MKVSLYVFFFCSMAVVGRSLHHFPWEVRTEFFDRSRHKKKQKKSTSSSPWALGCILAGRTTTPLLAGKWLSRRTSSIVILQNFLRSLSSFPQITKSRCPRFLGQERIMPLLWFVFRYFHFRDLEIPSGGEKMTITVTLLNKYNHEVLDVGDLYSINRWLIMNG